jgi:tetratricopeptide (TPR) repeat protein
MHRASIGLLPLVLSVALAACASPTGEVAGPPSLEEAIEILERETAEDPRDGEAWLRLGEALETLALRRAALDPSAIDESARSAQAFERAAARLRRDPRPRLGLARISERRGDREGAEAHAAAVLALVPSPPPTILREANLLLARAIVGRIHEGTGGAGIDSDPSAKDSLASRAREALAAIEADPPLVPEALLLRATLEDALGNAEAARSIATRGIDLDPEDVSLHLFLQRSVAFDREPGDEGASSLLDRYEALAQRHPDSSTTARFLGVARALLAERLRAAERWEEAAQRFADAERAFERSGAGASGAPGEDALRAGVCLAAQGWCRLRMGEYERAGRLFLAAQSRGALDEPDGSGFTAREGIDVLARAWIDAGDPGRALSILEEALEAEPDSAAWDATLGEVCVRAGLAAQAEGRTEAARSLFERSLACYERMLRERPGDLDGSSACALLLAQHLRRDFDRAELLLRTVADVVDGRLAIPDLSESERRDLKDRAAGAWEALGILYFDERRDPESAHRFFKKCLQYHPEPGTRLRWYLDKIEASQGSQGTEALQRGS